MKINFVLVSLCAMLCACCDAFAVDVCTGNDVYAQLKNASVGSQYIVNLYDETYNNSTDANNAHYNIMITELDAPDKVLVNDKYNVWACPEKIYSNQDGKETSDPQLATAWIITKYSVNTSGDGATDYYTVQSASSWRFLPNHILPGYNWLHTEPISYKESHIADFLYQIEVVEGADADAENPRIRLYYNDNGTRMYFAENDKISDGWGSNPIVFNSNPNFCSNISLQFPSEELQQQIKESYDIMTGIESVKVDDQVPASRKGIYDIYGRKVVNPVNGTFYIIDGKKVIYRN